MKLKKFEDMEDQIILTDFSKRITSMHDELEERVDSQAAELAMQLAEACYKEGYLDGCRITDWLHRSVG